MRDFIKNDVIPPSPGGLVTWIEEKLSEYDETLLAFADDGIIWGRLVNGKLATAPNIPQLHELTLQQAFIFGEKGELRLFRDEIGMWKSVRVVDAGEWFSESYILWGNQSIGLPQNGFLQVSESRGGIKNLFLPVDTQFGYDQCVRLEIHHFIEFDSETGEARIVFSRLAGLSIGKREMEVQK